MSKRLIIISVFVFLTGYLSAQFYVTGEPPASAKWQQIKAGPFKIIFNEGTEQEAEKFANLLNFYKDSSKIVPGKDITIPILMRTSTVVSNGYVSWAPKRMDIVTSAPQSTYPQAWLNQLALHEYRHIAQISALRSGFTGLLSVLTGEIATGLASSMVPKWFYEGDAVYNETRLSSSGRGRLPEFSMPLRTLLISDGTIYSYDKALFGSYKDFVPNHYIYGYHIVNYGVEKYGEKLWPGALRFTGRNPYLITPMAFYLLKTTGHARQNLYRTAMDSLKIIYSTDIPGQTFHNYTNVSNTSKTSYTSYRQPVYTDEGEIVSFKTGQDNNDVIVIIKNDGSETILHYPGTSEMESLSAEGNYIVWDEIVRDVRWGGKSYSEIMVFDRERNIASPLIRKSRLFSPDISPDGRKVTAIETDLHNNCFLAIIDIATGEYIEKIPSPGNSHLQTPEWTAGNTILAIALKDSYKQLLEYDPGNGSWTLILESKVNIAEPEGFGDYIIFRSVSGDVDDLFAIRRRTGETLKITRSRFGAFNPEISRDSCSLVYTEYSRLGFDIVSIPLDSTTWISAGPEYSNEKWTIEKQQENLNQSPPQLDYIARPYSRLNLVKFHSWLPFFTDINERNPSGLKALPGFMLFSQNITGTAFGSLNYFTENRAHYINPEFTFTGIYPVIKFSGEFSVRVSGLNREDEGSPASGDNSFTIESYVPWLYTKGRRIMQILPGISYRRLDIVFSEGENEKSGLDLMMAEVNFSLYRRRSYRDILPRLGYAGRLKGYVTPFNDSEFGNLYSFSGTLFLPGISEHHNFYIKQGFQKQQPEKYLLPVSPDNMPRGVNYSLAELHTGFSVNYTLPLLYPDLSLPSVLYIRRLWMNAFFDFSYGRNIAGLKNDNYTRYTGKLYSCGSEIYADINPLRFVFPVAVGIRIGFVPEKEDFFTEFIMTVNTDI